MTGVTGPYKSPCTSSSRYLARKLACWGKHADVAELLHVVEAREASHHLLGAEPPQGLKVEVPKPLVPLPCLVVPASCKTKRLGHPYVEDVEVVLLSNHPGEKLTTMVQMRKTPLSITTHELLSSSCPRLMMEFRSAGM